MQPVAIVILSKTCALLSRALASLSATHSSLDMYEVVVVDDGLEERRELIPNLRYIEGARPFCFSRNVNLGIAAASPKSDIVLMNDDVFFISGDGLQIIAEEINRRPTVGLITPVFARRERTPCQRLGHLDRACGLWIEPSAYLTFACVYLRRELLNCIGGLDESLVGYGYEDNDYCLRTRFAGFETGVLPTVIVGHGDEHGRASSTFSRVDNLGEIFSLNRQIFIEKWGKVLFGLDQERCRQLLRMIACM